MAAEKFKNAKMRRKVNQYSAEDKLSFEPNHRLRGQRGSASPVLTATGFVNGKGQFSTPTESTPLNRSPKTLSQVITSSTPMAVPN